MSEKGTERQGKKKALIIAISDFSDFSNLDFVRNDGEKVFETLKNAGYDIPDQHKLIGKVTNAEMVTAIKDFFGSEDIKSDDTLLFYYSGHGIPWGKSDNYFVTSDTRKDKPFINGFPFEELTRFSINCTADKIIKVLDCCYSGDIGKDDQESNAEIGKRLIDKNFQKEGKGTYVFASSYGNQQSYQSPDKSYSIFTYHFFNGLSLDAKELADTNGNITPNSLGTYIDNKMTSFPKNQRPLLKTEGSGDIFIATFPEFQSTTSQNKDSDLDDFEQVKIPDGQLADLNKKGIYYLKQKKYSDALSIFNSILKLDTNNSTALFYRGCAHYHRDEFHEAAKNFEDANNISPQNAKLIPQKFKKHYFVFDWAPVLGSYLDVDLGLSQDLICQIDIDNKWDTSSVHAKGRQIARDPSYASKTKPTSYYSWAETQSHYFLLYCFYHLSSEIGFLKKRSNTMNGCLVIIEKEENNLLGLITYSEPKFELYSYKNRLTGNKVELLGETKFSDEFDNKKRIPLIQESQTHYLKPFGKKNFMSTIKRGNFRVIYEPAINQESSGYNIEAFGEKPKFREMISISNPGNLKQSEAMEEFKMKYNLVDMLDQHHGLWPKRKDPNVFQYFGIFNKGLYKGGSAPWAWHDSSFDCEPGLIWSDPAKFVSKLFTLPKEQKPISFEYVKKMDQEIF